MANKKASPPDSTNNAAKAKPRRVKNQAQASSPTDPPDSGSPSFPVVGIGASAGGLSAFKKFFSHMPADSGMAFVLVPHLAPTHESLMVELLARQTTMPVCEAADGMPIEPNRVYIIPPNKYLAIAEGRLQLSTPAKNHGAQTAIDFFFRSLAAEKHERAIGVILSGTSSHGTLGLKEIKLVGGMVMAQQPETAEYDQMPRSAIATGLVDFVLPPEQMPDALVEYAHHPYVNGNLEPTAEEAAREQLGRVLAVLKARTKYDFRSYRKNMLLRRVQRRMGLCHIEQIQDYLDYLRENPDEVTKLYKDLLIGVTGFFRDPEAFQVLQERVIPDLIERSGRSDSNLSPAVSAKYGPMDSAPPRTIRVWTPACATGEETYTLAMLFIEQFTEAKHMADIQIFATDIDEQALETARQGIYSDNSTAEISPERLRRFFVKTDQDHWQVTKQLRESITFAPQNLMSDAPFSKLDLISCRNLLIYLEPEVQAKVIRLFHFALAEDGYLLLGPSESIGREVDLFEPVSKKWRVFRRLGPVRRDLVEIPSVAAEERRRPRIPYSESPQTPANGFKELMQSLILSEYAPASVLINRKHEILCVLGPLVNYLEFPPGEITKDLLAMARPGLRTKLRAAIHKAVRSGASVTDSDARVKRNGDYASCSITVKPITEPKDAAGLLLVTFADCAGVGRITNPSDSSTHATADEESDLLQHLEHELKSAREDLQSTIEEYESSNEELKASNEEVMSMNEELQSANEELESSKEELQSLNEELSTVNNQLQDKVEELDKSNSDLTNLMTSSDVVPDDKREEALAYVALLNRDETVPAFETRRLTKDGRVLDVRLTATICRGERGRPIGVATTERDITEQNRDAAELKILNESLEQRVAEKTQEVKLLAEAMANLGEGVMITTDHLNWPGPQIVYVNDALCQITGYTAEELIGHTPRILQGLRTDRATIKQLRSELSEKRSHLCELVNYRKDGTTYDAELFITPLFDADGTHSNFIAIHRDISQRKQDERRLRESEERLRTILNAAADAIITIDQRGIIDGVNSASENMFGYTADELIGQNVKVLMPAPYCDEHDGYIARYLETGQARIIGIGRDVTGRRKDGSTFPISLSVSEVDHLGLFTGIIRDISDRRKLQKQILEIAAEGERRIGHELHDNTQQQLTGLGLLAQSLADALTQESNQRANMAARLAKGIRESANHVHMLSRGLVPVEVDAEGLRSALSELAARVAEQYGIRCDFQCAGAVEMSDNFQATHLYRIAQEAVNNAIKHGQASRIDISLTGVDEGISLKVLDDGIGISLQRPPGPGMGLQIMDYRASLIGATVQVAPGPDGGTLVNCTILRGGG